MHPVKQKVHDIAKEIYVNPGHWHQIVIDFIQEEVEDLFDPKPDTSDAIGSASYQAHNIREIMNPTFENEIDFLVRLENALDDWQEDSRSVNNILGLPPQN